LIRKYVGKNKVRRLRHSWEANTEIYRKGGGWKDLGWIQELGENERRESCIFGRDGNGIEYFHKA
jgi:hypothetical protein